MNINTKITNNNNRCDKKYRKLKSNRRVRKSLIRKEDSGKKPLKKRKIENSSEEKSKTTQMIINPLKLIPYGSNTNMPCFTHDDKLDEESITEEEECVTYPKNNSNICINLTTDTVDNKKNLKSESEVLNDIKNLATKWTVIKNLFKILTTLESLENATILKHSIKKRATMPRITFLFKTPGNKKYKEVKFYYKSLKNNPIEGSLYKTHCSEIPTFFDNLIKELSITLPGYGIFSLVYIHHRDTKAIKMKITENTSKKICNHESYSLNVKKSCKKNVLDVYAGKFKPSNSIDLDHYSSFYTLNEEGNLKQENNES